jgi:hypothetical protein
MGVSLQADLEASVYHTSRLVSTAGVDAMTTQRDVIYTAKAETRVKVHKRDKASVGITVARLVEEGGPPTKVTSWAQISMCAAPAKSRPMRFVFKARFM